MKSVLKTGIAFFITLTVVCGLFYYFEIYRPQSVLKDITWWDSASEDEKRQLAHHILKYPVGNHHDAAVILIESGNSDSLPYLLNGLKWHNFFNRDADFTPCTKDHFLEALAKITGKKPKSPL